MKKETGSLDINYAKGREKNKALVYRLNRRSDEVISAMKEFLSSKHNLTILDLGTADGKMLNKIQTEFSDADCVGIEYSEDLVKIAKNDFPNINVIQGDIQNLSFLGENFFDVVVAAAVIEHIPDPQKVFEEVYKKLNNAGLFILTSPDPFWEELASLVGHLAEDQHFQVMNLKKLQECALKSDFQILKSQKFMFSPIGFPFEKQIEKVMRACHLNCLMANQLLVLKK